MAMNTLHADIFHAAPAALVCLDADGVIVDANAAVLALVRWPMDQVVGHDAGRFVCGSVVQRWRAWLRRARQRAQGGHHFTHQVPLLRSDGQVVTTQVRSRQLRKGNRFLHVAWFAPMQTTSPAFDTGHSDGAALWRSDKLSVMGGLLAGVAHELNNPLAIALGRATLLQEKCRDPELHGDARRIRDAVERCVRITRTFLNMARARPPRRVRFDLDDAVRAAVQLLQPLCRSHRIELDCRLNGHLPKVMGDPDQLSQIVVNLMVNAQQAMETVNGPRRIMLSTGAHIGRSAVWLQVRDSGPGVLPELRASLFQPFFTTKPEGQGTGLGLPLSQALARANGGELTLEPGSHGGAVFRLVVSADREEDARTPGVDTQTDSSPQAPSRGRILLVDDEPELLGLMRTVLERAGHDVTTASSGSFAIDCLAGASFDAIVSDFRMPELDGAGLWRHVKRHQPPLAKRMLFVTGDTLSASVRHFLQASGCPCLEKPFSRDALLGAVAALLPRRAAGGG
jgi:PAS domain S-box-containing protein